MYSKRQIIERLYKMGQITLEETMTLMDWTPPQPQEKDVPKTSSLTFNENIPHASAAPPWTVSYGGVEPVYTP
jgi:hypothetical protein